MQLDRVPEPAELDVDELVGMIVTEAAAHPETTWEIVLEVTKRRRVLARLPAPALGYAWASELDGGSAAEEPIADPVSVTDRGMTNGLIEIAVGSDGTFRLAGGGAVLDGVGRIVDGGDAGDSYNYGPPSEDRLVRRPDAVDVRHVASGPLRGELVITRRYGWPRDLTADATGRSDIAVPTDVVTTLELRAGEPFVRVGIEFDNGSRDHRVRWHIPLPAPVESSYADGQFAVVERGLTPEGGHGEVPLPTFPAVGFVSVAGCSVLLDQVTEYEVIEGRELALTLLRSFGLISRNANPYREDPAGPEVQVPAAQLPGRRSFGFALLPHAGGWLESGAVAAAEGYRHPFVVIRGTGPAGPAGDRVDDVPGIRLEGDGVVLSALRRRDDHLELRIVNELAVPTRASVHLPLASAREADLLGRPGADLATARDRLDLDLGPWEIRTVQLQRRAPATDAAGTGAAKART